MIGQLILASLVCFWIACNIIVVRLVKEDKITWKKYAKECQRTIIGQIMMTMFYWPAVIVLTIKPM